MIKYGDDCISILYILIMNMKDTFVTDDEIEKKEGLRKRNKEVAIFCLNNRSVLSIYTLH